MAVVQIPNLPAAVGVNGSEQLEAVQSGVSVRMTVTQIAYFSRTFASLPLGVEYGGTGLTSLSAGYIPFGNGTNALGSSSGLFWDSSNARLGIGTTSPTNKIDVNSDSLRLRTAKTPASATASGSAGEVCWDANYVYVCVATNTWKRAAISSW